MKLVKRTFRFRILFSSATVISQSPPFSSFPVHLFPVVSFLLDLNERSEKVIDGIFEMRKCQMKDKTSTGHKTYSLYLSHFQV
jgi:hypothetical protein